MKDFPKSKYPILSYRLDFIHQDYQHEIETQHPDEWLAVESCARELRGVLNFLLEHKNLGLEAIDEIDMLLSICKTSEEIQKELGRDIEVAHFVNLVQILDQMKRILSYQLNKK